MRKGSGRQRFVRDIQEARTASRKRNANQISKSLVFEVREQTPLCPFEVSCPLWRSHSLLKQHQDTMSPCEHEFVLAPSQSLVVDSLHGSVRLRSGAPRNSSTCSGTTHGRTHGTTFSTTFSNTPCKTKGSILRADRASLDGPFWTPIDDVLFPSTAIGSFDPMRAAGI